MKTFQIWVEGHRSTGDSSKASLMGEATGEDFRDACNDFFFNHDDCDLFDPDDLSFWGCDLFATEAEARESFG